ncbi:putative ATP-dependent RNA helicase TDRD12 isoform X2 [Numida meleagris]|uniref:putative ATP-dependent RNA helicase TDRD12 isoform X2 n=1 Tax=Numida meleagris TaxID=8996 RepID=UPI000B3DB008|nr:putative ATP-dependent RNA helicase TDRD12 isoform X2 [Numida meleagris]
MRGWRVRAAGFGCAREAAELLERSAAGVVLKKTQRLGIMEVLILRIEDPGCFWVTMKGCGPYVVDEIEYKKLNAEMNQFYDKSCEAVDEVKPITLEKDQVKSLLCVVFSEELKCWCRAVVKSIMYCADHYQIECFLVDYAKYTFVKSKDVRVAVEAFTQIPFRAKKCRLYCTKPVTLRINFCEDTAKIVPAKRWDNAATQYFQSLLQATTQIKAKLCTVEDNTFHVILYVTIEDEKVCINDDLVSKNFAHFEEAEENIRSPAKEQENQTSLNIDSPLIKINPALALRPVQLQEKVPMNLEAGRTISGSLEKTYQRSNMDLKENNESRFQDLFERSFVCLSNKIEPTSILEKAPLHDNLKKELAQEKFLGPNFTESYCWPAVARGCDVVAISYQGNDPFLYIPPVLAFLQVESCYKALPKRNGPLVLILCPGWRKAQIVFELLKKYSRCSRLLHPVLILLGKKKEEAEAVKIQGCEIIVTTPYSLLRLYEYHLLLFCRLCHLILDEIEVLFSEAAEEVFIILDYYKKNLITEEWKYSPHQIIAVGTQWNKHIGSLIKEFMNDPYIVITALEEASIYGNVQQVVQYCVSSERTAVLLKILDFTPNNLQKVLVFTNSVDEVETVHKALKSNSIFAFKIHKEMEFNFKCFLEHWTKSYSNGSHVVLVLTDDCMQFLEITDASCVIHFSFPSSPTIFGQRLYNMSDNFHNVIKDSSDRDHRQARSVIMLTENSECHTVGILHYLERAEAHIPPELSGFLAKVLEAEEKKKFARPLCTYLKMFGTCKNRAVCPDRHQIDLQIDMLQNMPDKTIQTSGYVTVLPLHIVNATNYFGRIVDKQKDQYAILAEEMNGYFKEASNRVAVQKVEKLALYGFCEETVFHRVQVVETSSKEDLFLDMEIKYIDEGRTRQVQSSQLLHLPARFQHLPPQAMEFIVCRVKPIDNDSEWNPRVTHYIHQKIERKPHEAKVVLTLGNTVWIDPMVRVTRLPDLKVCVNEYSVRSEILSTGLGTDNPEHISQLQKLYEHVKVLSHMKNLEPLSVKEDTASPENVSELQNMSVQGNSSENCNSSKMAVGNHLCDGVTQTKEAEDSSLHQQKCFYPEIQWFENEEAVTVKVKIARIADYKCEFSKEKVIFSACSGGKFYLADMELHQCILTEKSACEIKDKEAIIVLRKEKKGAWCKLLKNKNPHVSFDFEHWEDFEDKSPFPVGTKKLYCTAAVTEELIDSSEDSSTESDE